MENKSSLLPRHIAIIMDGNGRWAKQRGLPRSHGHKKGAEVFKQICSYCAEIGIEYVTFYAFSTENWKRSAAEVAGIMNLLRKYLDELEERAKENEKEGYRIRFLGSREGMPEDVVKLMEETRERTKDKEKININIAFNYGARTELTDAVKAIARKVKEGELVTEEIDEELVSSYLYTAGQPDPDLIIRPSGEYRLSNFLLWQSAYSEIFIDDILWPDYTSKDLDRAIEEYSKRNRRFGGV